MPKGPAASNPSRGVLGAATLVLAGFLALALGATLDGFSALDHRARDLVQMTRLPWLDPVMRQVSCIGERAGLIPLIVVTTALLWRPRRRWALAVPPLMAGAGALQWLAKWAVDRPRPNLTAWGFPSGHVLSLVVLFGLLTYLLCASSFPRRWRRLGTVACAGVVLAVGWTRLYLDMHWVSDVAGGFILGLAYLLPAIWLVDTALAGAMSRAPSPIRATGQSVGQLTTIPAAETFSVS